MDWVVIGVVAQLIAAMAVVVSLIYLASQIRSQNLEYRIASVHEVTEAFRGAIISFQNPNLAEIFVRAKNDFESLPEVERLQFISMVQGVFRVWEDAYYRFMEGRLDERTWKAMVVQFSGYLGLPGVQRVWAIRKQAYSEGFRDFVDRTTPREYVTQ